MAMAAPAAAEFLLAPQAPRMHRYELKNCRKTAHFGHSSPHVKLDSRGRNARVVCMAAQADDPFLKGLAAAAQSPLGQEQLRSSKNGGNDDIPPLLNIMSNPSLIAAGVTDLNDVAAPRLMAAPAQVETSYRGPKPSKPPPDLPSLVLDSRIVYIGMPLVSAVTELVVAELLYLQYSDPRRPIYMYINSTGTARADGETVGLETEGFAIYDTMQLLKNEIHTVGVGAAIGQACLLLAAGTKGKRYMLPHATAMIQQPRMPNMGQMPAIDVHIRAKEMINNRDTLVELLALHTGNTKEKVSKCMERPFYMTPKAAIDFGVIDKVLWRGDKQIGEGDTWDMSKGLPAFQ